LVGQLPIWRPRAAFDQPPVSPAWRGRFEILEINLDCLDKKSSRAGDNGMILRQNLFMSGATFNGEVILVSANIDDQLDMRGATFAQKVNGNGLQVGQSLMTDGATFNGEVILVSANIDGQLSMRGSTFAQKVDGESLHVGNLFLRELPMLVHRPRQLRDESVVRGNQPAHQSLIKRRFDDRASSPASGGHAERPEKIRQRIFCACSLTRRT
jgi:hypothetical protein